jgi:ribonuclease VapC
VIVDSSALLSVVFGEPGFEVFAQMLAETEDCKMSAATFVEVMMVAEGRGKDRAARHAESLIRNGGIAILPVTVEHAYLAVQGFSSYGKGKHAAGLNFGDCFSYALAKALDEPLLFKGDDFRRTDITPAIA